MNKIFVFIKSDGLSNTIKFIWNAIKRAIYNKSATKCLYSNRQNVLLIEGQNKWIGFRSRIYTSYEELESINFDRLKTLPYKTWLKMGSSVVVVFKEEIPVAFGWTHLKEHDIECVGKFDMGDNIAWLGPSFVHHKYRGNGLQQFMVYHRVINAPENITTFITSVNSHNIPSLKTFEKCGFKIGCEVFGTMGIFSSCKTEIKVIDKNAEQYLRIIQ